MANINPPAEGWADTVPLVHNPTEDDKGSLRLCQDCQFYERSIDREPCKSCLPKAREVPGWRPRTQ